MNAKRKYAYRHGLIPLATKRYRKRWCGLSVKQILLLVVVASGAMVFILPRIEGYLAAPKRTLADNPVLQNCDQARALGLSNARKGEPGYWPWLDRDNDGIACEPYYGL